MGWFGIGNTVDAVGNTIDKVFTNDEELLQAKAMFEKIKQHPHIMQAEINKIDARSSNIFQAGWRPMIGWVAGCGLALEFIVRPLVIWVTCLVSDVCIILPNVDSNTLLSLVFALLGLGGMRTIEKIKQKK